MIPTPYRRRHADRWIRRRYKMWASWSELYAPGEFDNYWNKWRPHNFQKMRYSRKTKSGYKIVYCKCERRGKSQGISKKKVTMIELKSKSWMTPEADTLEMMVLLARYPRIREVVA